MAKKKTASATTLTHDERRERREKIVSAVRGGATLPQLTRRFGVCFSTIRDACLEAGVVPPEKKLGGVTDKDTVFKVLMDLVNKTGNMQQIADKHRITRQRVHNIAVVARRCGWRV